MCCFRAIVPQRLLDETLSALHERGIVEFRKLRLQMGSKEPELQPLLNLLLRAEKIAVTLQPPRRMIRLEREPSLAEVLSELEKVVSSLEPAVQALVSRKGELEKLEEELRRERELAEEVERMGIDPERMRSSERITMIIGRIEAERVRVLEQHLREEVRDFWLRHSGSRTFVLVCLRRDVDRVFKVLYRTGAEVLEGTVRRRTTVEKELEKILEERKKLEEKFEELREKAVSLLHLLELGNIYRERLEATSKFGYTEATVLLEGWIPKGKEKELEETLEESTAGKFILRFYPVSAEEEPPVLLANPPIVRDFELLTEVYGPPKYEEVDPTFFLFLGFPLFFAICVGDAGYGLILGMVAVLSPGIFREVITDRLKKILLICAVVTIPIGLLVGGVFGFNPLWVNPIENPIPLLKLAILFGVLHLVTGFLLMSVRGWWQRDALTVLDGAGKAAGVLGFFGLCFSILGVGLHEFGLDYRFPKASLFEAFNPLLTTGPLVFRILFYLGLSVSVVAAAVKGRGVGRFSGALGTVYGVTGWVSDAASYTRLMALSMATGIIAFTINYLLGMLYDFARGTLFFIPMLILLAVMFFLLHFVNALLGALGGFVHTMRLHFVEFFSKFYEGGGRKFSPFRVKRDLVRLGW